MMQSRYTSHMDHDDKALKQRKQKQRHRRHALYIAVAALCALLCLGGYPRRHSSSSSRLETSGTPRLVQVTGAVPRRSVGEQLEVETREASRGRVQTTGNEEKTRGSSVGAASGRSARRLWVSSHGRVQWLDVDTGEADVIHEGRGVYYGVLPDGAGPHSGRAWVVSRPHNWRVPEGAVEAALLLDTQSGALLREVRLPSLFTHDMIRCGDKVYLADTGHGTVWELHAANLSTARELRLFTVHEHVNTLACWPSWPSTGAPAAGNSPVLMAVLHNLGPSQLAQIDPASGSVIRRLTRVGDKSHGLSLWRGKYALMLSSGEGRLIQVDIAAAETQGSGYTPKVLWEDPQQTFMKGLTVIDDVAYFGVSAWGSRKERDDESKTSEVVAFDLTAHKLLWRRVVHTKGLLNIVAAPHLSEASTGVAQVTWNVPAPVGEHYLAPGATEVNDGERTVQLLPSMPYDEWDPASGTPPRQIKIENKAIAARTNTWQLPAEVLGHNAYVSLRHVDIGPLVAELTRSARQGLWDVERAAASNAVLLGREENMARYKPGVQTVHLVFSDNAATQCYHFPWWADWKPHVMPIISQIMGWYGIPEHEHEARIVRLQLARMGPGGAILKHSDTGRWATGLHRIHVPLITNPEVHFLFQADAQGSMIELPVAPGNVFEINNVIPHQVHNSNHQERVHLLLDFAEQGMQCGQLKPGQACHYRGSTGIECPDN